MWHGDGDGQGVDMAPLLCYCRCVRCNALSGSGRLEDWWRQGHGVDVALSSSSFRVSQRVEWEVVVVAVVGGMGMAASSSSLRMSQWVKWEVVVLSKARRRRSVWRFVPTPQGFMLGRWTTRRRAHPLGVRLRTPHCRGVIKGTGLPSMTQHQN